MNKKILILTDDNFDLIINKKSKLFLVYFWANWCSPCKMMIPIFDEVIDYYKNSKIINFAKIEIDNNPDIVLKFSIKGVPSFLLFYNDEIKDSLVGTVSKEDLINFIKKKLK